MVASRTPQSGSRERAPANRSFGQSKTTSSSGVEMPSNNKVIRIIKREERNLLPDNLEGSDIGSRTELSEKQGNREILKNVTLWIEQQREKKEIEWRGSS
jgi:hypothetical protein